MKCNVCGKESQYVFSKNIMNKYKDIKYYKCPNCGFLQTEKPFWIDESYEHEAISIDPDRLKRNIFLRNFLMKFINKFFDENIKVLDFAGGEGILTRLMLDKGYDFTNYDKYSNPLYSFGHNISKIDSKYDLIISSEVMEHIENPYEELDTIFKYTDNYFFTTCMQVDDIENWFYLIPENGQHISFYTNNAIAYLAEKYNMNCYSDLYWCHFFTKKDLGNSFTIITEQQFNENEFEHKTFNKLTFKNNSNFASYSIQQEPKKKKTLKQRILKSTYKKFKKITDYLENKIV